MATGQQYVSSFSGADVLIHAFMDLGSKSLVHKFGDVQTISISGAVSSTPVLTLGRKAPVGYSVGDRTCAGSIVFSHLDKDPIHAFISELQQDPLSLGAVDGYVHYSDLPPFDIMMMSQPEAGVLNEKRDGLLPGNLQVKFIFGVQLLNSGSVVSIDDMLTEHQYSYVAQADTIWLPYDTSKSASPVAVAADNKSKLVQDPGISGPTIWERAGRALQKNAVSLTSAARLGVQTAIKVAGALTPKPPATSTRGTVEGTRTIGPGKFRDVTVMTVGDPTKYNAPAQPVTQADSDIGELMNKTKISTAAAPAKIQPKPGATFVPEPAPVMEPVYLESQLKDARAQLDNGMTQFVDRTEHMLGRYGNPPVTPAVQQRLDDAKIGYQQAYETSNTDASDKANGPTKLSAAAADLLAAQKALVAERLTRLAPSDANRFRADVSRIENDTSSKHQLESFDFVNMKANDAINAQNKLRAEMDRAAHRTPPGPTMSSGQLGGR